MIRIVNKSIKKYKVDGRGTEELVEKDGVITALPSMDIRYPDGDVMLDQSFLYRVTANGTKPNISGTAHVYGMRGNTVKWNQLCVNGNFKDTNRWKGNVAKISAGNGVLSITKQSTNINNFASTSLTPVSGHTTYVCMTAKPSVNTSATRISYKTTALLSKALNSDVWEKLSKITNKDVDELRVYVDYTTNTGAGTTLQIKNVLVFDLTEMFGTDAQIAAALGITEAQITTAAGTTAFEAWLLEHVGQRDYYAYDGGSLVPTRFESIKTTGSDWESSSPFDITSITGKLNGEGESVTIFPDGLKRVGDVYDEIVVKDGVLKAIKRVAAVDLGNKSILLDDANVFLFYWPDGNKSNVNRASLIICAQYVSVNSSRANMPNMSVGGSGGSNAVCFIKNESCETAAEMKAALNGVIAYYVLNTPKEYVLDGYDPKIKKIFLGDNEIIKAYKGNNKVYDQI